MTGVAFFADQNRQMPFQSTSHNVQAWMEL